MLSALQFILLVFFGFVLFIMWPSCHHEQHEQHYHQHHRPKKAGESAPANTTLVQLYRWMELKDDNWSNCLVAPTSSTKERVVIIVPGLFCTPPMYLALAQCLKKRYQSVLYYQYNFKQDIASNCNALSQEIMELFSSNQNQVYLVGHDLGGLMCRHIISNLIQLPAKNQWIKQLTTLGAPLKGIPDATYDAFTTFLRAAFIPESWWKLPLSQMLETSEFMSQVQENKFKNNNKVPILAIAGKSYEQFVPISATHNNESLSLGLIMQDIYYRNQHDGLFSIDTCTYKSSHHTTVDFDHFSMLGVSTQMDKFLTNMKCEALPIEIENLFS
jgi:predicted alpha/beta hydrolase family esterase